MPPNTFLSFIIMDRSPSRAKLPQSIRQPISFQKIEQILYLVTFAKTQILRQSHGADQTNRNGFAMQITTISCLSLNRMGKSMTQIEKGSPPPLWIVSRSSASTIEALSEQHSETNWAKCSDAASSGLAKASKRSNKARFPSIPYLMTSAIPAENSL